MATSGVLSIADVQSKPRTFNRWLHGRVVHLQKFDSCTVYFLLDNTGAIRVVQWHKDVRYLPIAIGTDIVIRQPKLMGRWVGILSTIPKYQSPYEAVVTQHHQEYELQIPPWALFTSILSLPLQAKVPFIGRIRNSYLDSCYCVVMASDPQENYVMLLINPFLQQKIPNSVFTKTDGIISITRATVELWKGTRMLNASKGEGISFWTYDDPVANKMFKQAQAASKCDPFSGLQTSAPDSNSQSSLLNFTQASVIDLVQTHETKNSDMAKDTDNVSETDDDEDFVPGTPENVH
jgi:hypothetical protein